MGENLPILVTISVQKIQAGASPQKLWFRPSFWPFNARIFAEKAPVFICTKMSSSEELVTLHFEYPLFPIWDPVSNLKLVSLIFQNCEECVTSNSDSNIKLIFCSLQSCLNLKSEMSW